MSTPPAPTAAALRRAPSTEALMALCAVITPGGRVGGVRRLRGGTSSGMHAVDLFGANGERRSVVVRRYGAESVRADPLVAVREWSALGALARVGAPTPRPLWRDVEGAVFGCPTIVTSLLPGRGLLAPRDPAGWVRQLAEALDDIHRAPSSESEFTMLLDQRSTLARLLDRDAPPPELANQPGGTEVWSAMGRWWPNMDVAPSSLLHGDYWPGNTLWRYGRLTGVVDWEQAGRGDPCQDVACCRLDLAFLAGPEAAESFLLAYQATTGRVVSNLFFWDLYMVTRAMGQLECWVAGYHDLGRTDITVPDARTRLARFTADAMSRASSASRDPCS